MSGYPEFSHFWGEGFLFSHSEGKCPWPLPSCGQSLSSFYFMDWILESRFWFSGWVLLLSLLSHPEPHSGQWCPRAYIWVQHHSGLCNGKVAPISSFCFVSRRVSNEFLSVDLIFYMAFPNFSHILIFFWLSMSNNLLSSLGFLFVCGWTLC